MSFANSGSMGRGVAFNPLTQTYDTPDGTKVAAEVADNVNCLADVLVIANIREGQRDGKDRSTENS